MNRIERLLDRLCPNGVEYKKMGDIAIISRGGNFQKKDILDTGVPCIHYGQIYTHYGLFASETVSFLHSSKAEKQKMADRGDIIMAVTSENVEDVCKSVVWLGEEQVAISGHTAIIKHQQEPKYLAYYLESSLFQTQKRKLAHGTKVIEVTPNSLNEVLVPVPPLEVQREIVQILDKFTLLSAELSAELSARKKQYEYYKSSLFDFDESVPTIKIGDFTRVFSASRVHKSDWKNEGVPFWRSSDLISFYNGVENSRGKVYISQELYEKLSAKSGKIEKDDILVTGGGTIGIPYIVPSNDPFYVKDADLLCIKKNDVVMTKYLYHYFLSQEFKDYLMGITHDATIAHYTISQIKDTPIPVPSMDKQKKIVEILDKFEDITKSISEGLPAEIDARNKQYEYYRDKLLTFDKAV